MANDAINRLSVEAVVAHVAAGATVYLSQLPTQMIAGDALGELPDGVEPIHLVMCRHREIADLARSDLVPAALLAAHCAEVDALGYDVSAHQLVGVGQAAELSFPRSAIASYPQAVNELLELERAIERELPTMGEKPGRAETNLHALVRDVKAIDDALVVEFYDSLIDRYLDAGNENYANRQAKAAIAAMKTPDAQWMRARLFALLDRGFFSSMLVDKSLELAEKAGADQALELHLEIAAHLLDADVRPNQGTYAALARRVKAAKAQARLDALLLERIDGKTLLYGRGHKEIARFLKTAGAAVARRPQAERLALLERVYRASMDDGGDIAMRCSAWQLLADERGRAEDDSARAKVEGWLTRIAIRTCKNVTFGYTNSKTAVDESFRGDLAEALEGFDGAVIAAQLDHWAEQLDDYSPWAHDWFFDTHTTILDIAEAHPQLLEHGALADACFPHLVRGITGADEDKRETFLARLVEQLGATSGRVPPDASRGIERLVELCADLCAGSSRPGLHQLLEALAAQNGEALDALAIALVPRALDARGGHALMSLLRDIAPWISRLARGQLRQALAGRDAWEVFVQCALDGGATLGAHRSFMVLAAGKGVVDDDFELFDMQIIDGAAHVACGDPGYKGKMHVYVDGTRRAELRSERSHELTHARFRRDGQRKDVVFDVTFGDDDTDYQVRSFALDGSEIGRQSLGEGRYDRVFFARHQRWVVAVGKSLLHIFDERGVERLAQYEGRFECGSWSDWFNEIYPLRAHLGVSDHGGRTLIFGDDPTKPTVLARRVAGLFEREGELVALCHDEGDDALGSEVVALDGTVRQRFAEHQPGRYRSSWSGKYDHDRFLPTNLRGGGGDELLLRTGSNVRRLESAAGELRVAIDTSFGSSTPEILLRDLDGDGFEELYAVDDREAEIVRFRDAAAPRRALLCGEREALLSVERRGVALGTVTADELATALDSTINACGADLARAIGDPAFAPAREALGELSVQARELLEALEGPEQRPAAPTQPPKRARLPRSLVERLGSTHFPRPISQYPFAEAMHSGSIDEYRQRLCRKGRDKPESAYVRRVIQAHLDAARETGLEAAVRGAALDLAEQLLELECETALSFHYDSEPAIMENFSNDAYKMAVELLQTRAVSPASEANVCRLLEKLPGANVRWEVRDGTSIFDVDVLGHVDVGANLVVMVQLQKDDDDDDDGPTAYWSIEKPRLYGTVEQVSAARPKLLEICGRKEPPWPAKVWPRGESGLTALDEWMTDAERASLRGEIAALRALSPDETTVGRAAHGPQLARLAERFKLSEDTAAVLAALVLHVAPERDHIAEWSAVKRTALSRHFKKLSDAKLIEKHDKDYRPKVPIYQLPGRYRATEVPAFQRLYFVVTPEFYDSKFHSSPRRCFSEADVLGAYIDNIAAA